MEETQNNVLAKSPASANAHWEILNEVQWYDITRETFKNGKYGVNLYYTSNKKNVSMYHPTIIFVTFFWY